LGEKNGIKLQKQALIYKVKSLGAFMKTRSNYLKFALKVNPAPIVHKGGEGGKKTCSNIITKEMCLRKSWESSAKPRTTVRVPTVHNGGNERSCTTPAGLVVL